MAIQTIAMPLYTVNPTTADVKGALNNGAGGAIQEEYLMAALGLGAGASGKVLSGFTLPSTGSRTAATVAAGSALVGGYYVVGTATTTVTFEDATTSWVWLQLTMSSGLATGAQLYVVSGATFPAAPNAPAVVIGRVVTSGGNITSAVDMHTASFGSNMTSGAWSADASPTITNYGNGAWTMSKTTGNYVVTFPSGFFAAAPALAVAASGFFRVSAVSATGFTVLTFWPDISTAADAVCSFIAIG